MLGSVSLIKKRDACGPGRMMTYALKIVTCLHKVEILRVKYWSGSVSDGDSYRLIQEAVNHPTELASVHAC